MPFAPAPASKPPPPAPVQPPASRKVGVIIWSALIGFVAVAWAIVLVLGSFAPPGPGAEGLRETFLAVAAFLVVAESVMSYVVTARMRRSPPAGASADQRALSQTIVGTAVPVGAALACCLFYFLTREPLLLALAVPAIGVILSWFPSQARWARLAPAPAGASPPARTLVRE